MFKHVLFKPTDIAPLVVFRIFFGLLMVAESWGAILTGWVAETFVNVNFSFTFIGFEWTQFLVGPQMYVYFFLMGIAGWGIALGYKYRLAAFYFAFTWSLVYLMQKSHYNNHYYLVALMSWFMAVAPANQKFALDTKRTNATKSDWMPNWVRLYFIVQVGIVYFFAAIAKLYPGWMNGDFLRIRLAYSAQWFSQKLGWNSFADFLASDKLAVGLSWGGFWFDFLVIPALLWKPTRKIAFFAALVFHLFNSVTLHIGIFPYFALALAVFFYPPATIRRIFRFKMQASKAQEIPNYKFSSVITMLFIGYFAWQVYLPLRHWHIPDDVLWTEEGHRLSWRMMLRTKSAVSHFFIEDDNGNKKTVKLREYLSKTQIPRVRSKPDMMWQFAQHLKTVHRKQGKAVKVFVRARLSINGGPYHTYIDEKVDLANVDWNYWGHQSWILPSPESYSFETNALK